MVVAVRPVGGLAGSWGVRRRQLLGIEPDVMAPGFELMRRQNPSHSNCGAVRHDALRDELASHFDAIRLSEAMTQQIPASVGQVHDVDSDLWGKTYFDPVARSVREAIRALDGKSLGPPPDYGQLHANDLNRTTRHWDTRRE